MKLNYLLPAIIAVLLLGFTSCSDDDKEEKPGTPLNKINFISNLDLSNRAGWLLHINNLEYTYTPTEGGIIAIPKDKPYHFKYGVTEVRPSNWPYTILSSPDYFVTSKSLPPPTPNIGDQSTLEKLRNCDRLYAVYQGAVNEEISNVELKHSDALLDFDVVGLPAGFTVKAFQLSTLEITPYKEDNNYKAVVLANFGTYQAHVHIMKNNELHTYATIEELRSGTHYKFTVKYDEKTQKITLENLQSNPWTEDIKIPDQQHN